jgi:hypothetical protein
MERKSYITRRFNQILSETINEKANELMGKLKFNPPGTSFDYVQEGKEMCNECGKPYTIMAEVVEGETCECGDPYSIEVKERLIGGQRKLDKNKNNKIDAEDFKLLRKHKKEMREYTMGDDDIEGVKPYGDMSTDSPNIKPGKNKVKNVGFDYQKKVAKKFDDYELEEGTIYELEVSENFLKRMFGKKKEEETPIEEPKSEKNQVGFRYDPSDFDPHTMMHRSDMEAMDNEFRKRKESPQPVKNQPREKRSTMSPEAEKMDKDWGGLASVMGVDPREAQRLSDMMGGETNETETDESREFAYAAMMAKKKGKKTFELDGETFDVKNGKSKVEETYYRIKVDGEMATFSENEMIDIIESIVKEEKDNIKKTKQPAGYAEYERVHRADGKEGEKYFKDLAKKMTDYTKDMSDQGSKFETKETQKFPTGNGNMKKGDKKKYTASDAVDEYVEAFNYGSGQTGLTFDEIKPNDKNIEKYMKGDSSTGNAQVDEDGNALGNVVPSKVGDKFYNMYKNNLFGQEQAKASYKRQPQPVDIAGEETESGSLKSKRGKGKKTAQSVLDKLDESVDDKKNMKLNEEFSRMQQLMGYNQKTQ